MSTTTKARLAPKPPVAKDAIAQLKADHVRVSDLFATCEKTRSDAKKRALVANICTELSVHAQIEEEIFYPAVRAAIDDNDSMDEADVEHAGAKELIAQLVDMDPGDDHFDAKVTVLGENIDHHVKEEQEEMFPKAKKAKLDLAALGAQMLKRKQELQARSGGSDAKKNARAA